MVNIFIALSQHHLDLFEKDFIKLEETKNRNILISSKQFVYNHDLWDEVFVSTFNFHNQENSKIKRVKNIVNKIKAYKALINKIDKYRTATEIVLYYSSLEDVLTNYMFFYFNENIKGIIVEDGVLNYYDHSIKNVSRTTTNLKRIFGFFFGLKYKNYKGHTTGIDYDKCLYQYVRMPSYAIRPEKSKALKLHIRTIENISEEILIIGQEPYANLIGSKEFEIHLIKLYQNILNSESYAKAKTIYYKPHRNGPRIDYSFLQTFFKDKKVEVIESNDSVENIFFNEVRCKYLFTFDSSSVVNISAEADIALKNEIEITTMPILINDLSVLFAKLNFKILNDDL